MARREDRLESELSSLERLVTIATLLLDRLVVGEEEREESEEERDKRR